MNPPAAKVMPERERQDLLMAVAAVHDGWFCVPGFRNSKVLLCFTEHFEERRMYVD